MDSVRTGLRSGDLAKDNYGRLACTNCETELATRNDPDEIGKVRVCPDCETEWQEM